MVRNARNLGPISMAVLLHVVLLSSMVVAFDYARPSPITPLMIRATLVTEIPKTVPPPVIKPEPIPEQIPDNSEELRLQAEEEKRRHDTLIEKERLEKMRRQKEVDRKKEEARKQRLRDEAERKRLEDIQRQREENDRLRKELETEQRQAEIDDEERRFAARDSAAMAAYRFAIAQSIRRNWSVPASAGPETRCSVRVTQLPGGEIVGVNILSCNSDDAALKRSVEAAIHRSSPLPEPSDPDLFDRNLRLNLTLERDD